MHSVGQVANNVHKTKRVLQKTNFLPKYKLAGKCATREEQHLIDQLEKAQSDKLQSGDPAHYGAILKHLLFRSSGQMLDHLKSKGVSLETQYLGE